METKARLPSHAVVFQGQLYLRSLCSIARSVVSAFVCLANHKVLQEVRVESSQYSGHSL